MVIVSEYFRISKHAFLVTYCVLMVKDRWWTEQGPKWPVLNLQEQRPR